MQLVINVPEKMLKTISKGTVGSYYTVYDVVDIIQNGTPLPKGHGAIVDLKQVIRVEIEESHTGKKMVWNNNPKINDTTWRMVVPVIIKADKEN